MNDYIVGVPAESIVEYCPGGYHPVHLGDFFKDGQYQIIQKLGFGSFSTVWLARDLRAHRNVSIKVVVAEKSGELDHELLILKHLNESTSSNNHPGKKYIVHLLDFFYLDGPNGRHLCLVFNVLGPNVPAVTDRRPYGRLDSGMGRDISTQVLLAVDYLHSSGIVHGDIYTGNILLRVPELDTLSPEDIITKFGQPTIGQVTRRDGKPSGEGVPKYVVHPIQFRDHSAFGSNCEVQLIDFGESFFVDHPPKHINTPISLHPPELVLNLGLTNAIDIWNLGCTTYELITGRPLFEVYTSDNKKLIPQFERVIGKMPEDWIANAIRDHVLTELPNVADAKGFLPLEDDITEQYFIVGRKAVASLSKEDISELGKALRKMLALDPRNRIGAHELLGDPWFTKSSTSVIPGSSLTDGSGWLKGMVSAAQRSLRRMFVTSSKV